jgi:hypothetical protein
MRLTRWLDGHRTGGLLLIYTVLAIALAIPILASNVPLGVDDLNHLARIHVRAHIGEDANLSRLFELRSDLYPYLGMDLLLTPLARVLPTMLVGRIYTIAILWGLVGATIVVQRAFTGRVGIGPAATGLVAYNSLMAWGLINYVLGIVVALLLFAAWHWQRARSWLFRLVVFCVAATGLYLTHLLAFVLYGVLVGSYELFGRAQPWRTPLRDWLVLAGQAVPALLLWNAVSVKMPSADLTFHYIPMAVAFALESPFLFSGAAGGFDAGLLTGLVCGALLIVGLWRGWLVLPRSLAAPVLVLLVLTIIVPFRALGVALLDYRPPVAAACLILAGLRLTPSFRNLVVPIATALAALTIVHVVDVASLMHRCDAQYGELRDALTTLPRGAELTTVLERSDPAPGGACTRLPIYEHIAQLVTIDRSGYAPDFFARVTSVAVRGGRVADSDPVSAESFIAPPDTRYLLWIHLGRHRADPAGFVPLRRGSFFDLWAATAQSG